MKKFMRKAKNVVLKTVTAIAAFGLFYSLCALEQSALIPLLGVALSSAWIAAYCYANKERFAGEKA